LDGGGDAHEGEAGLGGDLFRVGGSDFHRNVERKT
jgi:hypothetical protein